ncbi:MAG: DUF1028 domain-containing protein [Candidatus Thermoplasmatota archaeon]|nr:DUF1028 domain-containing protein [Candidatus Thermoplasmatota archaeon]
MTENMELGTFSIVARDRNTGDFGVGSATAAPCVGALLPFAEVGVGAIATQAWVNVNLGYQGLALMRTGLSVKTALESLLSEDPGREKRQVIGVDSRGCFGFTGVECTSEKAHFVHEDFAVAGNILTSVDVLGKMEESFRRAKGELSHRILSAVQAGQEAGGDMRGKVSATLLVASSRPKIYHNLRIDLSNDPVKDLAILYERCRLLQDEIGEDEEGEVLTYRRARTDR